VAGKTYTIKAQYTPTNGAASSFTIVSVTVDCVVTGFTNPSAPTGASLIQYIKGAAIKFDFNDEYVQTPACGHTYTSAFTWTGTSSSFMTVDGDGVLTV
jgi:hypothetical protein